MKSKLKIVALLASITWTPFLVNHFILPDGWIYQWWGMPLAITSSLTIIFSYIVMMKLLFDEFDKFN